MPELPDITVYLERLEPRILGQVLERVVLAKPFVLRSVEPPLSAVEGRRVVALDRVGKRIVIGLEGELFLLLHLMIAGRLRWLDAAPLGGRIKPARVPRSLVLATFVFPTGTLVFTEAGSTRRASLHVVQGREGVRAFDRGGLDVRHIGLPEFAERLASENHTLKRSLTDPRLFDGIGNAYSDEILHRARLSPLALSKRQAPEAVERLYRAARETLDGWTERLRAEVGEGFPEKVTAFRDGMAVHGRFREPCPVCGAPVQRIRYATNETNYCARCQTGGRLLADRALSRLLREDWPRSIDEVE
jgi:formamidopyrimidine-DNA glycosylase